MKRFLLIPVLLLIAGSSAAQTFEKVLIPVWANGEVPGAFGSRWVTELSVFSRQGRSSVVGLVPLPCNLTCVPTGLTPGQTIAGNLGNRRGPALLVALRDEDLGESLSFQLRVRDLSRQSENWGTEIPVVRERNARLKVVELLDVPVEQEFRHNLRIYDFDAQAQAEVRVRLYAYTPQEWDPDPPGPVPTDRLVYENTARFKHEITLDPRLQVGYIELNFLSTLATFRPGERMRVEITPVTPALRFWGFLTITNNNTQQISTITPQ